MSRSDNTRDFADLLYRVRRDHTPKVSDPGAKRVKCAECGVTFIRGRSQRQTTCPKCSRRRQVESSRQLKAKEGPIYDKMVARNLNHWTREARRLGIFPDEVDQDQG